ncbi:MAG: HAMP domain-containing histidine kinase [Candidatus Eisenbacteria bacterium]|uniref:histidine kinase n=1 Tax=Eiseniibacteriota bacterium TaxID=2212470 RepID=A0A956NA48_UNCEI|nr:HAMP domain-containing histidine kinase [Candidatus Eisenbacteria bacterium]MCB9465791.1 HAMP domain-containing histidine kinase [Candidatus Eisenbacteria bacterium]
MKLGWGSRQILSLSALAVVLAITSVLFEIHNVLRLATDRALTEAGYVTDTVERTILLLNQRNPQADLSTLVADPLMKELLVGGVAHTPSLLGVAVMDPNGIAVAHGAPQMIGQPIANLPELGRPEGFVEAMKLLSALHDRQNYEMRSELRQGDQPFATIHASISGTLLWDEVRRVLQRGLITGLVLLFLALGLGVLLGQVTKGRLRILEEGVAGMLTGHSEPIPESRSDMFGDLARELNILRDRVQMEPRILANVGQLAAGMAHEMSQPIQAIQFALRELEDPRSLSPDDIDSHVGSARTAVERMRKSVDGFLRVVRIKPMAVESISLNSVLEQVQQDLETEANLAGLELDLDLDADLPETYADAQVLRQAVENLVKNAVQAAPSREGRVIIRSRTEDESILLIVEDTGPGIPDEVRPKVFNFYFTTKRNGTGVGLALVRQAAEIHGGTIEIDSEIGRGTTMTIRIPQRAAALRSGKKRSKSSPEDAELISTTSERTNAHSEPSTTLVEPGGRR